jgi:hypothetical protein
MPRCSYLVHDSIDLPSARQIEDHALQASPSWPCSAQEPAFGRQSRGQNSAFDAASHRPEHVRCPPHFALLVVRIPSSVKAKSQNEHCWKRATSLYSPLRADYRRPPSANQPREPPRLLPQTSSWPIPQPVHPSPISTGRSARHSRRSRLGAGYHPQSAHRTMGWGSAARPPLGLDTPRRTGCVGITRSGRRPLCEGSLDGRIDGPFF